MQIGVVATIAVHVLFLAFAPKVERWLDTRDASSATDEWSSREFQIELSPALPVAEPPQPAPLPTFVEANPNAPDNAPDKTEFVAAQNQQVAQETPTPSGQSNAPALKGDPTAASTAIVSGQLREPEIPVRRPPPSTEPASEEEAAREASRRAQNPLPGTEKFEGDNPQGVGGNVSKPAPDASAVPERVEGSPDGPPRGLYFSSRVDAKKPQARPTLAPSVVKARATPLAHREFGTENIGAIAYSAKWSAYGEYLQKFIESVDIQWKRIIEQSSVYPVAGTKVAVKFRMDSKGAIAEIIKVQGGGGRAAEDACVSAIVARDPYGEWSDDMIAVLGQSQEITFTFHYN